MFGSFHFFVQALLTLKEGFEGAMDENNIQVKKTKKKKQIDNTKMFYKRAAKQYQQYQTNIPCVNIYIIML